MTELQGWQVHELKEQLYVAIHNLVDTKLRDVDVEVAHEVCLQMNDEFRFWKRDL